MIELSVEVLDNLDRTILNPEVFSANFHAAMTPAIANVVEEIEAGAKEISAERLRSDGKSTGEPGFRESWAHGSFVAGYEFGGTVYNRAPYAKYVEKGRDAGKAPPPYSDIYSYLDAHGDFSRMVDPNASDPERARRSVTFATMHAIARDGIAPKDIRLELGRVYTRLRVAEMLGRELEGRFRLRAY